MRRGAGAVPARPHVTQPQEPAPRPRNVGTLAALAADPRGHTGGPGRHLILAAPPTSRVPVEVSHRGERSEERGGGLACGGASAQGPQARPRAPQASRGLGTNLALATATLTPRQARRPGPRREGRAWEETPTPRGQDAQTREAAGCGSAGVAPEALARVACRGRERGRTASPAKQGSSRCHHTANVGVKTKQEKPSQEPPPRSQPGAAPPRPVRHRRAQTSGLVSLGRQTWKRAAALAL